MPDILLSPLTVCMYAYGTLLLCVLCTDRYGTYLPCLPNALFPNSFLYPVSLLSCITVTYRTYLCISNPVLFLFCKEEAIGMYSSAVEVCLEAARSTPEPKLKEKLNKMAAQALDRAESIKQPKSGSQAKVNYSKLSCKGF